jgi:hypothetical protein
MLTAAVIHPLIDAKDIEGPPKTTVLASSGPHRVAARDDAVGVGIDVPRRG